MNVFWFSLGVNTAYFLADVFVKLGSNQIEEGRFIYLRSLFTVALAAIWLLISKEYSSVPSLDTTLQLIGCGLLCVFGLFYYVKALKNLHFANVAIIGILGAFIHYLLGVWINHEQFNTWFYLAAFLSTLGIIIQWRKTNFHTGILQALASAILWGFGYALLNIPLQNTSASWGSALLEVTALVASALYLIITKPELPLLKLSGITKSILAVAGLTMLGSVWLNIAYQKFQLSALGFMQLSFFPYSLLAGYFIFKEKLSVAEWIGNGLVVSGLAVYFIFI